MITLLNEEKIILKKRRHWFVIALELAPIVLAAIVPLIALIVGAAVPIVEMVFSEYAIFILYFLAVWWLLLWSFFFIIWTNYYLDIVVITNKRIIDIEQLGLFARDIVEVRIENIEDIKTAVIGFLPSLLDMGSLYIQTAGESREVIIKNIPNPHEVREVIAKCHDKALKNK